MSMSANNAERAKGTCKYKGAFASLALFADSYPLSEIRARNVEAFALFHQRISQHIQQ